MEGCAFKLWISVINWESTLECLLFKFYLFYFQLDSILSCNSITTSLNQTFSKNITEKKIIRITDVLLRDVQFKKNKILLYFFNDGTIEKKYINN